MKDSVILPVKKPNIITIPEHCLLQVILSENASAPLYLFYYSLQLIVNRNVRNNLNMNFCYGDNRHLVDHYPLIESFRVPDFIVNSRKCFRKLVTDSLREGYYLYFCVNVSDISLYDNNHSISGNHDLLLYGERKATYCVADFFDGRYSFSECDKQQVVEGFFNKGKSPFAGIYLMKMIENDDYVFDLSFVKTLLSEYIDGTNSATHYLPLKRSTYLGYSNYYFGINIYESLKKYILCHKSKEYAVRSFHILYEHKRVLQKLVQYMNSIGMIYNCDSLKNESETIVEKAFQIRTNVLKAIMSGNDYKNQICCGLDELKSMEALFMKKLIGILEHCESPQRVFTGKCLFKGYDRYTLGNWMGKYGNVGYTIFGKQNIDTPNITIHYENFNDKVWRVGSAKRTEQILRVDGTEWAACKFFIDEAFIDISVNSNTPQKVTFYFYEIYGIEREFEISIIDSLNDGQIQTVSLSEDGVYLSYEIIGSIRLHFKNNMESQGVVSAVFFDI